MESKYLRITVTIMVILAFMMTGLAVDVKGYSQSPYRTTPKASSKYFQGTNSSPFYFKNKSNEYGKGILPTKNTQYIPIATRGYGMETNKALYPDGSGNSWMLWSMQGRKSNQTFGYKATNCIKWNETTRSYDKIDVVNIVTSWAKGPSYRRAFGPYIAIVKNPNINVRTSGIEDMAVSVKYYKAGTTTPIKIKTNGTIRDIDDYQMVGISPVVDYITYKNSYLKKHVSQTSFACFRNGNIHTNSPYTAVGYVANTSYLNIKFGDNKYLRGNSYDKKTYNNLWGDGKGWKHFFVGSSNIHTIPNNIPDIKPFVINVDVNKKREAKGWNLNLDAGTLYTDDDLIIGSNLRDIMAKGQNKADIISSYYLIYKNGELIKRSEVKKSNTEDFVGGEGMHLISESLDEIGVGDIKIYWYASDGVPDYKSRGPVIMEFKLLEGKDADLTIDGQVNHLKAWDENRNVFNAFYYNKVGRNYVGNEDKISIGDYLKDDNRPRERYQNVFWPGEEFVIEAIGGDGIHSIKVEIENASGFKSGNDGEMYETWLSQDVEGVWKGSLWDESMVDKGGKEKPELINFVFTPYRKGQPGQVYKVPVIIDNYRAFWDLKFQL